MERLTERIGDGVLYNNGIYKVTCYPKNNNLNDVDKLAVKLCELEDKLESRQLVELPSKVGDAVWVIDYDEDVVSYVCIGGNSSFLFLSPTVYVGKDMIAPEELCNHYVDCYMENGDNADVVIFPRSKCFTDKAQAEARLKELQEKL